MKENKEIGIVDPRQDGFREKITPKIPEETNLFFKCKCGKGHFRHAGYVQTMMPFLKANGAKEMTLHGHHMMICVSCRKSYVWLNEQMYDLSSIVDVKAWEKSEKKLHKMTGPGGQC